MTTTPEALTLDETAERLGVTRRTVERLIQRGELRAVDVSPPAAPGRAARLHVLRDDLDAFIEARLAPLTG